jgi:hypothetical protein
MKKISIVLIAAVIGLTIQSAHSQSSDTTKNHIEIKKKVKVGAHGRQVTKIKMEGKGTPSSISGAAEGAATGKLPEKATPPAQPVNPTIVVVHEPAPAIEPEKRPSPSTTTVTTTTEAKPVPVTTTHITKTTTTTAHVHTTTSKPIYHKTYTKKPAVASSTKTTTTTTVKKDDQ